MKLLQELIRIPSQSGNEARLIEHIVNLLEAASITTYRQGANAVAFIPGIHRTRALLFNGHVDTVSEGDVDAWSVDPFAAKIIDKRVYGLGASDMKAGVAALLSIAFEYKKQPPACDLWFSFVVGEEVDGRGTQSFLDWFFVQGHNKQYQAMEAIIAEPTNNEFVGIGHRGNAFVELTIQGEGGHATAKNDLDVLAIPVAGQIIKQVQKLEQSWRKHYHHEYLGVPTIGITSIHSGDLHAPNQIDPVCTLMLDIRSTPLLHEKLTVQLEQFVETLPYNVQYNLLSLSPAGWCSEGSALRSILSSGWPELEQKIMTGSADQCFYSQRAIPAIIFGPGQRDRMHAVDEYFTLEVMKPYQKNLQKMITTYGETA